MSQLYNGLAGMYNTTLSQWFAIEVSEITFQTMTAAMEGSDYISKKWVMFHDNYYIGKSFCK